MMAQAERERAVRSPAQCRCARWGLPRAPPASRSALQDRTENSSSLHASGGAAASPVAAVSGGPCSCPQGSYLSALQQLSSTSLPISPTCDYVRLLVDQVQSGSPFPLSAPSAYATLLDMPCAPSPDPAKCRPPGTVDSPCIHCAGTPLCSSSLSCRPVPRPRNSRRSRPSATFTGVRHLCCIPSIRLPRGKSHRPCLPSSACLLLPFRPHGNLGPSSSLAPHVEPRRDSIRWAAHPFGAADD